MKKTHLNHRLSSVLPLICLFLLLPFAIYANTKIQIDPVAVFFFFTLLLIAGAISVTYPILALLYALNAKNYSPKKTKVRQILLGVFSLVNIIPGVVGLIAGESKYFIFFILFLLPPLVHIFFGFKKIEQKTISVVLFLLFLLNFGAAVLGVYDQPEEWGLYTNPYTTYHYGTEQPEIIANYSWGKKHGTYQEFAADGSPIIDGAYLNDQKHGYWKVYGSFGSSSGKLKEEGNYENGIKHGYWKTHYGEKEEGNYINGEKDSTWIKYNDDGNLRLIENYSNGIKHGDHIDFDKNGDTINQINYIHGKIHGYWKEYEWEAGLAKQLKEEGNYINGVKDSTWITYSDKGEPEVIENYLEGKKHGEYQAFDYSGEIQEKGTYLHDQKDGEWISYDGAWGEPKLIEHYSNGLRNGEYKTFGYGGRIKETGNYLNGEKDGEWKEYSYGRLVRKEKYKNGKLVD